MSINPDDWWSVPQAIVWIVSRSDEKVAITKKLHIRFLSQIPPLRLNPVSFGADPPIPLTVADNRFMRAARTGHITVKGCAKGRGDHVPVPVGHLIGPLLLPGAGGLRIVEDGNSWPKHYWTDLYVRAGECMKHWPARPSLSTKRGAGRKPDQRESMVKWLAVHYPNGTIPAGTKNAAILAEMKADGINGSEPTLRRALQSLVKMPPE
jgi:hypothetical protein